MRHLTYPVSIVRGDGRPPHLHLTVKLDRLDAAERVEHLAAMAAMAAKVPYETVRPAIALFATAAGEALPPPLHVTGEAVVIPLPAAAVSEPGALPYCSTSSTLLLRIRTTTPAW